MGDLPSAHEERTRGIARVLEYFYAIAALADGTVTEWALEPLLDRSLAMNRFTGAVARS